MKTIARKKLLLGWREWVELPQLGACRLKAKVDTGARTSALHAFAVEEYEFEGASWVKFGLHTQQTNTEEEIICRAPVADQRLVTDSGGHSERRWVIVSDIAMAGRRWPVELTLTNRDNMKFRMLLGRTAMNGKCMVDPQASYLLGELGTAG